MKHTKAFQETLFTEIVGRIPQVDASVPYKENGYWYYTRYEEGREYPVYCRKKETLESPEEVMLNVNEMADGFDYYRVTGLAVCPGFAEIFIQIADAEFEPVRIDQFFFEQGIIEFQEFVVSVGLAGAQRQQAGREQQGSAKPSTPLSMSGV